MVKLTKIFVLLLLLTVSTAGCFRSEPLIPASTPPAEKPAPSGDKKAVPNHLSIWTHYGGIENKAAKFKESYPDLSIDIKVIPYSEYTGAYLQALADGKPPDVMMVDSADFGNFSAIEGLEDLLQPPYQAGKYRNDFSPSIWESAMSADGNELIAFPLSTTPTVTYYREDIMRQYGFPSEPEELAKYMEDPANWLHMAKELREHNIYLTQWVNETVQLFERSEGIFDRKLNFMRYNEAFHKAVEIAKKVNDFGLEAHLDVWGDMGRKAVQDGTIAMMYFGTWGVEQIKEWAPETAGKWRETRLPFGLYGWQNSTNFLLPSNGVNKEMGWKFIEFAVTEYSKDGLSGAVPAYLPARGNAKELAATNPFLGGQKTYALHEDLMTRVREFPTTPLDAKAQEIWESEIASGIEKRLATKQIIADARDKIEQSLAKEKQILLNTMKKK
ncbi:ABC transporter substrate-binding protein [Paenibacillus chitinolyticus]|uniref:ABC transporter substrate-binding protein n=1 Tax=Paenibacillus chitinolyticus TaxID=79263 RepID=UPI003CFE33C7